MVYWPRKSNSGRFRPGKHQVICAARNPPGNTPGSYQVTHRLGGHHLVVAPHHWHRFDTGQPETVDIAGGATDYQPVDLVEGSIRRSLAGYRLMNDACGREGGGGGVGYGTTGQVHPGALVPYIPLHTHAGHFFITPPASQNRHSPRIHTRMSVMTNKMSVLLPFYPHRYMR